MLNWVIWAISSGVAPTGTTEETNSTGAEENSCNLIPIKNLCPCFCLGKQHFPNWLSELK